MINDDLLHTFTIKLFNLVCVHDIIKLTAACLEIVMPHLKNVSYKGQGGGILLFTRQKVVGQYVGISHNLYNL